MAFNNLFNSFTQKAGLPGSFGFRDLFAKKNPSTLPQVKQAPAEMTSPPPLAQSPQTAPSNPQIAAIQASLGGLKTQAEGIQSGLQNVQQRESIESRLSPFRQKASGLFSPSSEEEQTRLKLANLLSAREKGLIEAEEQAVPLQAILGEQGRIERRALAGAVPLQEQLAQLQARREGERKAAEFEFGAEKDIISEQREQEKFQRPDEEKLDEFTNAQGKRVVVIRDKKTGKVRQEVLDSVEPKVNASERQTQMKTSAISRARPLLLAAKGGGQYVDADTYLKIRNDYAEAIGNPLDFDRVFGPMLSPEERNRLGVGRTGAGDIADLLSSFLTGGDND